MKTNRVIAFTSILCLTFKIAESYNLQSIGNFTVSHPGFLSLIQTGNSGHASDDYSLYISSFNGAPFSTDHVYYIKSIGSVLSKHPTSIRPTQFTQALVWPNEVNQIPTDVFGKRMLSIAGGFLVPSKDRGSIQLVDLSHDPPGKPVEITKTTDDHQWFYHRVLWLDMNGDGRKDAITCRAKKPLIGEATGELVWYEHPSADRIDIPWNHYFISGGADSFFDMGSLPTPSGNTPCIVTAGFFSSQIKIYWTTDPSGQWTDSLKIKSRVIESSIGHVFDVQITDINNDKKPDLLVTTNGIGNTGVYAYQIPDDFRSGTFTKHVIKIGFHSHNILPGGGAPGSARAIPNPSNKQGKPLILLSGDDDSRAYILNPTSENLSDWSYNIATILDNKSGTVGGITSGDIDDDGHLEIFIPGYSEGKIHVYKLMP